MQRLIITFFRLPRNAFDGKTFPDENQIQVFIENFTQNPETFDSKGIDVTRNGDYITE